MAVSHSVFLNYKEQIGRMISRMSWEQISEIGRLYFVPVMQEHGQLGGKDEQQTALARQAEDLLQSLFHQGKAGDPAAARVFLQEVSKTRATDESNNVIINIVPYDVPDKLTVEIEGYEGDSDTGVGDAEEVPVGNPRRG